MAVGAVIVWAITGPVFHFSDTWQLVMNTVSSIITFCMVFVIQNSQNRDSRAIQLKLDEIIRATAEARNDLINLELAPEERLNETAEELTRVASGEVPSSEPEAPEPEHAGDTNAPASSASPR